MQKISESTSAVTPSGEFTEGNPVGAIPATPIKAVWLNAIQRELVAVIEGAGLTLDRANDGQVLAAVQRLVNDANTWASITAKPSTLAGFGISDAFSKTETTANIQAAVSALVASAPATLDTLKELATALGNDANFATTVTNALALKAPLASPVLSGVPTAPTAAVGTNNTQLATTAFVAASRPDKAQCTAWVNFNGAGTVAIRDSYNISSITDNGIGDYTIYFATAMNNTNYAVSAMNSEGSTPLSYPPTAWRDMWATSGFRVVNGGSSSGTGVTTDFLTVCAVVFGGKA